MLWDSAKAPLRTVLNRVRSRLLIAERIRLGALETTLSDHQNATAAAAEAADRRFSERILSLETTIEELGRSHGELSRQVGVLRQSNDELKGANAALGQGIDGLKQTLDGLGQDVGGLKQEVDGLRQEVYGLKQSSEAHRQTFDGMRQEVDGLRQSSEAHRQAFDGLRQEVDGLKQSSEAHRQAFDGLRQEVDGLKQSSEAHTQAFDGLRQEVDGLRQSSEAHRQEFDGFRQELEGLKQAPEGPREAFEELKRANDELARANEIGATMEWMPFAPLSTRPLISVVMPTRNRPALLARAIASVQAQSYPNWELLVIDDASTDGTPALLSSLRSDAIRVFAGPGRGVCAARNIGLAAARGDLIAYLDDDNIMHPNWLKSVAWGFEQWPQSDALYGAFVIDNPARNGNPDGELPRLYFFRYDKLALTHSNIADMSAIAHRNGLPEARFDETLIGLGDWDLMLRLTRDKPPIALPVIACFYTTDAPNRLTFGPSLAAETPIVQARSRQ
jgi:uncharacterized coiled-coil DUF342 family protein